MSNKLAMTETLTLKHDYKNVIFIKLGTQSVSLKIFIHASLLPLNQL